jgi:hypothetical protein
MEYFITLINIIIFINKLINKFNNITLIKMILVSPVQIKLIIVNN